MLTTSDGAVLSCGEGGTGSTAQGTSKTKRVPEKVFAPHQEATPEAAKAVEIPRYGTLESYQTSRLTKRLPAVNHEAAFTTVSVGWGHSLFLDASGRVFSSGLNTKGQLGVGLTKLTKFTTLQEVKVEAAYSDSSTSLAARKAPIGAEVLYEGNPGTVVGCARGRVGVLMEGEESKGPIGVPPVEVQVVRRPEEQPPDTLFVDDIACGATFSAALSGGVLYLWGQLPTDAPAGSEELLHPRVLGGWVPTLAPFSLFSDAFGAGEGDDGIRVRRAFHVCNRLLLVVDRVSDSPENSPGQPADLASEPEEA
ncbi:hypothetical protein DIPPA_34202 [Diplonema papillatum]|nr:hypothetical protein DIPPA_34202 [Diplonema papillatum]